MRTSFLRPPATAPPPQPVRQDLAAGTEPELTTAPGGAESIPKLTDSALILQAVAWSPDPLRRMAVINDLIVREGSTISGYSVKRITGDDVLVSQGLLVWRLTFAVK